MVELGLQIRVARQAKQLSQLALSSKTSVSREQISNIERGISAPAVNIVTDIAAALGCTFQIQGIQIGAPVVGHRLEAVPIQGRLQFDSDSQFSATSVTVDEVDPDGLAISFTLSSRRIA
jgi:transcriptional regulator with XRE-family HTH domain